MKINTTCGACLGLLTNGELCASELWPKNVDLVDDGVLISTCDQGHRYGTVIQAEKFTLLFELGIHAIIDGYHREAVSAFAASFENFCKYYMRIIAKKSGIESEQISSLETINNLSQNILGMYPAVHLLETNELPSMPSSKYVKFRNDVIHNGTIPSRQKTLNYGAMISSLIAQPINYLKNTCKESVDKQIFELLKKGHVKSQEEEVKSVTTLSMPLFISTENVDVLGSIEEYIQEVINRREAFVESSILIDRLKQEKDNMDR